MKILAVSDIELSFIYSLQLSQRFKHADLLFSCGDLPYFYLEFMVSMLDRPLYYVRGNHAHEKEYTVAGVRREPQGAVDLHRKVLCTETGLLLAGIEGCNRATTVLRESGSRVESCHDGTCTRARATCR